jgi:hypothetical protein
MMVIGYSETSILQESYSETSKKKAFFIAATDKTSDLTWFTTGTIE